MKIKFKIRTEIRVAIIMIMVIGLVAFADRNARQLQCRDIVIRLDNINENHFLDEADVLRMVEAGQGQLRNMTFDAIDFRDIEQRLRQQRNLKDAQVYNDFKGNLIVEASLRRPIARLAQEKGADAYLSEEGVVMSVSERYSSRVVVLSGPYVQKLFIEQQLSAAPLDQEIMQLLQFIRADSFWSVQVAEVHVLADGKVWLFPQVGNQVIAFGLPSDLEQKFFRLKVFYKEILPRKGWNKYDTVSLEYAGQVVAK